MFDSLVDATTGTIRWQQRLGGNFSASPLAADGRIYFLDEDGKTTVIKPGREFKELAMKQPIKWDEAAWLKDQDFIKAMIHREIDVDLFGVAAAYQNLAKRDPQLQFALTQFPEAVQLLELSRQSTARRASANPESRNAPSGENTSAARPGPRRLPGARAGWSCSRRRCRNAHGPLRRSRSGAGTGRR